jgi:signal transduction histidine kinase/DNA-binding response OmpR family regulator
VKGLNWSVFLLVLIFYKSSVDTFAARPKEEFSDSNIWLSLIPELETHKKTDSYFFITQTVEKYRRDNLPQRYKTYNFLMKKLEERFDLPAAIFVCHEMAKVSLKMNDPVAEANAYRNLNRFYDALGYYELAIFYIDKTLTIYNRLGLKQAYLLSKFDKISESLKFSPAEEVLPKLREVLTEAYEIKDAKLINTLHLFLMENELEAKNYEEAAKYLQLVEKIPVRDSSFATAYNLKIITSRARSEIAFFRNDLDQARIHFRETLELCRESNGLWFEIFTLHSLARLEIKAGEVLRAKMLLGEAQSKARGLDLYELLAENYELQFQIAEGEGRFEDALGLLKKKNESESNFSERSKGFSLESYQLKLENEKIEAEQRNQELELNLKKAELRNTIFLLFLGIILVLFMTVVIYRLTKRKKELELKNMQAKEYAERLKSLDLAKSNFYSNINHEIRTPLTLILGPIKSLLKDDQLDEKHVKLLKKAHQSSEHLRQLVNNVLDLKKAEEGKSVLAQNEVDLYFYFENHLSQFDYLANQEKLTFVYEINIPRGVTVKLDSEKCRQIIFNLLSNAFKFNHEGGEVFVSVTCSDSICKILVKDSGIGISEEERILVFDRFYQAKVKSEKGMPGTGIGLALCMEYVKLMNGEISLESELGKGSVFTVLLPLESINEDSVSLPKESIGEDKNQLTFQEQEEENVENKTRKKVLVVEDNSGLRDYIEFILEELYTIDTVKNGKEALDFLNSKESTELPDLIISDLMMPEMDGYELLKQLKSSENFRHLPVVILTARTELDEKLSLLRIGVDDYLTKPFEEEELVLRVKNLFKNQDLRRAAPGVESENNEEKKLFSDEDLEWLKRMEEFVKSNLSDKTFSVSFIASEFAMSESTLLRQLKKLTGLSTHQYLQEVRLTEARKLFENRTYTSVSKVADLVGYSDHRTFSRSFKNRFGKLPTDFL